MQAEVALDFLIAVMAAGLVTCDPGGLGVAICSAGTGRLRVEGLARAAVVVGANGSCRAVATVGLVN